ncbi:uncharacterized protein LOC108682648 isoform X3 [Hyalella azteca]|uniref:Uncharacterized protein LOC108682648 isoform X3 n=1 Tax=Hyalella azteca TaxID=294128 RepID=A0A8B7PMD8_HYAAZ|nr:uncharacterized protein LOC108682648 isoform X3 [Hyalella azteca]
MPILLGNNILGQVLHSSSASNYRLRVQTEQAAPANPGDDDVSSNNSDPAPGEGFNVVGVLLAVISVILIIIGIAFVYSRMRRGKLSPAADEPDMELAAPTEQEPEREKDPYMEWLNMPEEQPPTPDLRKQMKTAVRTVSRKISLAQKKEADDFKIGVPPHLRYQLKEIYVY